MAKINRFEDLEVWKLARKLSHDVFRLTQEGSFSKDFELKNQINRASGSIMDNIAEGFGRGNRAEFILFLGYSTGSSTEVKSQLYRALDRKHISQEQFDLFYSTTDRTGKMLFGLIQALKKSPVRGLKYKAAEDEVSYDLREDADFNTEH
ncbi:four helix bundle protein [Larkinella knui]|uniref:Four helix bundle protein n=1 Tax=Larkinella knui TaxID=2025310 RepID=A0A3P1CCD5_9BACT|nr:four helix bundle protein [Larkinella knui]RRB11003.1 four helix bundle protein [Larkinella knui]